VRSLQPPSSGCMQSANICIESEDGGRKLLRNTGKFQLITTPSYPKGVSLHVSSCTLIRNLLLSIVFSSLVFFYFLPCSFISSYSIMFHFLLIWSSDISVNMVDRLWVGRPRNWYSSTARGRASSFIHGVQTSSGVKAPCCALCIGINRSGHGALPPLLNTSSWRGASFSTVETLAYAKIDVLKGELMKI
jgi:hypothetical protein